ncbi:hypothetical protein DDD_0765 [Nonlabens dokdonensis DSW-6]|uniref:Uncharacterized protein n=1 Tax=Nonlabens dokdonensis (strain DSM 17205 / KCTC 12402 / DSW-6) TaxID=592029 RepID=L7W7Y0_NONDD|nr:hypothetical protein DDD_0765 [Nonlabens dokdonensis DSW-6]
MILLIFISIIFILVSFIPLSRKRDFQNKIFLRLISRCIITLSCLLRFKTSY